MNFPELQPAPPVGFNLTFMCPEGQVCFRQYKKLQTVQYMFMNIQFVPPNQANIPNIWKRETILDKE